MVLNHDRIVAAIFQTFHTEAALVDEEFREGVVRFVLGFEERLLEFGWEALDGGADGLDGVDALLAVEVL